MPVFNVLKRQFCLETVVKMNSNKYIQYIKDTMDHCQHLSECIEDETQPAVKK